MEHQNLLKVFLAGIALGNGPCLFACLPIVMSYIVAKGSDWKSGLRVSLIFSLTRLFAYSVLGALSVAAYRFVNSTLSQYSVYIKITTGILILLIGILYILGRNTSMLCRITHKYLEKKQETNSVIIGLLIGFSPCLPLLGVLTYIAATADTVFDGLLFGIAFGAGTFLSFIVPFGVLAGLISENALKVPKLFTVLRIVSGVILILMGLNLVL